MGHYFDRQRCETRHKTQVWFAAAECVRSSPAWQWAIKAISLLLPPCEKSGPVKGESKSWKAVINPVSQEFEWCCVMNDGACWWIHALIWASDECQLPGQCEELTIAAGAGGLTHAPGISGTVTLSIVSRSTFRRVFVQAQVASRWNPSAQKPMTGDSVDQLTQIRLRFFRA